MLLRNLFHHPLFLQGKKKYFVCLWEKTTVGIFISLCSNLWRLCTHMISELTVKCFEKQHFSDFLCNVLLFCQKLTEVSSSGKHSKIIAHSFSPPFTLLFFLFGFLPSYKFWLSFVLCLGTVPLREFLRTALSIAALIERPLSCGADNPAFIPAGRLLAKLILYP